jgi:hypothetical protein
MGEDTKVIRVPKEDMDKIKALGKKKLLVTLDDEFLDNGIKK